MDLNELKQNIKKLRDNPEYIHYFTTIVDELDLEIGRSLLEEVADFTQKEQLRDAYGWVMHRLGWTYLELMEFDKATDCHMISYEAFLDLGNAEGIIAGSNGLMADYATQELWDLAIEWGLKGMELAEQEQNEKALKALLLNTAIIYVKLKKYTKSKEMLDQVNRIAYPLATADRATKYTIEALSELGLGNGDKAIEHIEKAYKLTKDSNNMELSEVLMGRGKIYTKLGSYELAKKSFEEGLNFARKNSQSKYIVSIMIEWAKLDICKQDYLEAIEKLLNTQKQIDKAHARRELKEIYFNLGKSYKVLGKSKKSLFYMEKYLEIKEEIANNQSEAWMTRLDYKKAEREAIIYKTLYNQIEHLSSIGQKITATLNLDDVIDIISTEIKYILDTDVFELSLYDEEEKQLKCVLCIDNNKKIELGNIAIEERDFSSYCIQNEESILLNNIEEECSQYVANYRSYTKKLRDNQKEAYNHMPQSALFIPLKLKDKVIGVMSVQSYKKQAYTRKDLNTLKILGSYIAIALENTQLFEEVEYRAAYDVLTGIYNRGEIIKRSLEIYETSKETTCLIMIDIDDFKKINDTYGHIMGDKVLKEVACAIKNSIREEGLVGRYGGEEFLVTLPCSTLEATQLVAEKIRKSVEDLVLDCGEQVELQTSISLGVTHYRDLKASFEELVKCADEALYCSKKSGKNQVNVYQ
ncbi:MAG: diguanylate cyclase [Cellulosilyticaceae bacterium]